MSSIFDDEPKEYLRPDYSEETEKTPYDDPIGGPSEDDDDYDINDFDEAEEDRAAEKLMNDQEKLNEKIMTQTPFGQPSSSGQQWGTPSGSPWTQGGGNSWGQQSYPWQQNNNSRSTWGGNNSSSPWGTSGGNSNFWNGSSGTGGQGNGKKEIDRGKEVVFCDVLDCLIETLGSNGRPGLLPRGIYDMRLRFEVWDKIACFNPSRIFAMIPRNLILSSNGSNSWLKLLDYVICSLSEYLRVPYGSCQIVTLRDFGSGKDSLIDSILVKEKIKKSSTIQIGLESGLYGQSNRDILVAQKLGIDYIDLGQLMNMYF